MTKVLILGGDGMLGHKAYQVFSKEFDTYATFLDFNDRLEQTNIFNKNRIFNNVNAFDFDSIGKAFTISKPDFIFNCIGIIKQLKESKNHKTSIYINSLLPHLLADLCDKENSKLIHISTDCIFSGKIGNNKENDFSDAEDLYGKTKYLGEVNYGKSLTVRTSIIGHELFSNLSLVDWFLSQKNKVVYGYTNAIYTGFPTVVFCNEIKRIIKDYPKLSGLYNLSSGLISKYDLLNIINDVYQLNVEIIPNDDYFCDRSIDSTKYKELTHFTTATWNILIKEMYNDYIITNYTELKK